MRTLTKQFNLSDVGLAKLCRRHEIPTPGVGYWQLFQAGRGRGCKIFFVACSMGTLCSRAYAIASSRDVIFHSRHGAMIFSSGAIAFTASSNRT